MREIEGQVNFNAKMTCFFGVRKELLLYILCVVRIFRERFLEPFSRCSFEKKGKKTLSEGKTNFMFFLLLLENKTKKRKSYFPKLVPDISHLMIPNVVN
jgi:hypothetical protein